jgi:4-hydroxy-tetrahydrodipicolinate synthase
MPRHATYVPQGVIPAVLLPFDNDFAIDETSFRKHLRDVAAVEGLSAITVNAHSTEVGSCSFEEQKRVLEVAQDEIGARLPLVNGIWADGSIEAARIARMATQGGASALLVFPPAPFTLGQSPAMALAHFKRIADASDLPLIVFQYPLTTGQGYPKETLLKLCEEVPSIRAIKDWIGNVPHHESRVAKSAASGKCADHPQLVVVPVSRARLQRIAVRLGQRDRRFAGEIVSRCSEQ